MVPVDSAGRSSLVGSVVRPVPIPDSRSRPVPSLCLCAVRCATERSPVLVPTPVPERIAHASVHPCGRRVSAPMPMSVPASAGADARSGADGRAGANARAPGTTADANAGACGADADADADVRAGADALPSPCLVPMPMRRAVLRSRRCTVPGHCSCLRGDARAGAAHEGAV